jgi:hypothetical protein
VGMGVCGLLALTACGGRSASRAVGPAAVSSPATAQTPSVTPSSIVTPSVAQPSESAPPSVPAGSARATESPATYPSDVRLVGISGSVLTIYHDVPPDDYEVVLTVVIAPHQTGATTSAAAPTNGEFEVASVSIDVHSGSFPYDKNRFAFLSPNGETYAFEQGNAQTSGFGTGPESATLTAGQHVAWQIPFDVPHGGGQVVFFGNAQPHSWSVAS